MDMPELDYSKLKGRIKEKVETQGNLANYLKLDDTTISNKINQNTYFTQKEIFRICKILSIESQEIAEYFFKPKVRENEHTKSEQEVNIDI